MIGYLLRRDPLRAWGAIPVLLLPLFILFGGMAWPGNTRGVHARSGVAATATAPVGTVAASQQQAAPDERPLSAVAIASTGPAPHPAAAAAAPAPAAAGGTAQAPVAGQTAPPGGNASGGSPTVRVASAPASLAARPPIEVPILMYHHVGPLPANADALRRDLTVTPQQFEQQVTYLAQEGYITIPAARLAASLRGEDQLPPQSIILTFDDGYQDNYEYALPALKRSGLIGTFFIVTGLLGQFDYLTWDQVRAMADAGMDIQSHGKDHLDMSKLTPQALENQLSGSRRELEARLNRPVRVFAYPAGRYSPSVITAVQAAGYVAAISTNHGTTHSPADAFDLRRLRVRGSDTLQTFARKFRP